MLVNRIIKCSFNRISFRRIPCNDVIVSSLSSILLRTTTASIVSKAHHDVVFGGTGKNIIGGGEDHQYQNPTLSRNREKTWFQMLQEMIAYKNEYGDCLVPVEFEKNPKLGKWVDRQRQQYRYLKEGKSSHLEPKRIEALEREGFVWSSYDLKWSNRYKELLAFKEIFGHCIVPRHVKEYDKLWAWVFKQKRAYSRKKKGLLSPITDERIQSLEKIGFVWDLQEEVWFRRLQELRDYRAYHGDCIVPKHHPSNENLGIWVEVQRRQRKLSHLSEKRIELLDKEHFVWDVFEFRWQRRFEELSEFFETNGHSNIPMQYAKTSPLTRWVKVQRNEYNKKLKGKKTSMTERRLKQLQSINFIFDH